MMHCFSGYGIDSLLKGHLKLELGPVLQWKFLPFRLSTGLNLNHFIVFEKQRKENERE